MLHLALTARAASLEAIRSTALIQIYTCPRPPVRRGTCELVTGVQLLDSTTKGAPVVAVHHVTVPAALVRPARLAPVEAWHAPAGCGQQAQAVKREGRKGERTLFKGVDTAMNHCCTSEVQANPNLT